MGSTPMLDQYLGIKKEHPGAILFFHLGDFYEMFNDDALIASRELELTLTSREAGKDNRLPMCGVPVHSANTYIGRLVERGYKVAICEQVEDPREARGLVRREIVRIVTPGTFTEGSAFEKGNGFIVAVSSDRDGFGLATADISTGEFMVTQWTGPDAASELANELFRLNPLEIVLQPGLAGRMAGYATFDRLGQTFRTEGEERQFRHENAKKTVLDKFGVSSAEGFGCAEWPLAVTAAGALLAYINETQKNAMPQITRIQSYSTHGYMYLDSATRRNLELTRTLREGEFRGTLLWSLDQTVTPMGKRMMRRWVEQPLLQDSAIMSRQEAVASLVSDSTLRRGIRQSLDGVYDLERLTGRVAVGTATPRDLVSLKVTLKRLPELLGQLGSLDCGRIQALRDVIDPLPDITELLEVAIADDPPVGVRDGGIIRQGYSRDLEELRAAVSGGKDWMSSLEARERERTGIRSLKVGFNQIFGYYIEVTRSNLASVPADYQRKQTLAACERYITPELKQYEDLILGASEKMAQLEYDLFSDIRGRVAERISSLQGDASALAELDVLASLAEVAVRNGYVRPELAADGETLIKDGRHPVVERMLESGAFVPNDTFMNHDDSRLHIITGPNMAGKSTYLRQVALVVLMAQIGSFVPASYARIGLVDRIFTRVGASDDLATGQSTFMVEMHELANILNHATRRSLLILDEIGRGTSTFDGLSIAWAVIEYLQDPGKISPKTLFATHYHELTELEGMLPGIRNLQVAVKKKGEDIVFLRKITPGGADRSYGIEVARLAGLPEPLLARAREILGELECKQDIEFKRVLGGRRRNSSGTTQLSLFQACEERIIAEIRSLDLTQMSPLEAFRAICAWRERLSGGTRECAAAQEGSPLGKN